MHQFCRVYTPKKLSPEKGYTPICPSNVCRFLEEAGVCRFGWKTYPDFGRKAQCTPESGVCTPNWVFVPLRGSHGQCTPERQSWAVYPVRGSVPLRSWRECVYPLVCVPLLRGVCVCVCELLAIIFFGAMWWPTPAGGARANARVACSG